MLIYDPRLRITPQAALSHPFLSGISPTAPPAEYPLKLYHYHLSLQRNEWKQEQQQQQQQEQQQQQQHEEEEQQQLYQSINYHTNQDCVSQNLKSTHNGLTNNNVHVEENNNNKTNNKNNNNNNNTNNHFNNKNDKITILQTTSNNNNNKSAIAPGTEKASDEQALSMTLKRSNVNSDINSGRASREKEEEGEEGEKGKLHRNSNGDGSGNGNIDNAANQNIPSICCDIDTENK